MHELSIARALLGQVENIAAQQGAHRIAAVTLAVGPLSGVEAALLTRAFAAARAGTIAGDAVLQIETMPVMVWCRSCMRESGAAANNLVCATCGSWNVELRSGNELLLKRVELTVADGSLAAE